MLNETTIWGQLLVNAMFEPTPNLGKDLLVKIQYSVFNDVTNVPQVRSKKISFSIKASPTFGYFQTGLKVLLAGKL